MQTRMVVVFMLVSVVAGCATAGPSAAPRPEAPAATRMVYTAPASTVLLYDVQDSTTSQIQAGPAGTVTVELGSSGLAEVRIEPDSAGEQVTVGYREFSGSTSNSASGAVVKVTEADVKAPAVLRVDTTGGVQIVKPPQLTEQFVQVAGSESAFRRFFVRVPAGPVRPGAVWVDTVTSRETAEGITTTTTSVITATYAGDTTVAAQRMNHVTYTATRTVNASGTTQGVEMRQKLNGTATGYFIWDPARNAVYEREETVTMNGGFDLPALGMEGLPISAHGRVRLQLRSN